MRYWSTASLSPMPRNPETPSDPHSHVWRSAFLTSACVKYFGCRSRLIALVVSFSMWVVRNNAWKLRGWGIRLKPLSLKILQREIRGDHTEVLQNCCEHLEYPEKRNQDRASPSMNSLELACGQFLRAGLHTRQALPLWQAPHRSRLCLRHNRYPPSLLSATDPFSRAGDRVCCKCGLDPSAQTGFADAT